MKKSFPLLLCFFTLFLFACSGTKNTTDKQTASADDPGAALVSDYKKKQKKEAQRKEVNSLEDYLRRIPGLQVSAGSVRISGANSSLRTNQPLFIVDGVRMGHSLSQVSQLVNVQNIDKVRVLKDVSETSFYGSEGSNGVIVIKMKKN